MGFLQKIATAENKNEIAVTDLMAMDPKFQQIVSDIIKSVKYFEEQYSLTDVVILQEMITDTMEIMHINNLKV